MQDSEGKFFSIGNHSYTDYRYDLDDPRGLIEYPYSRFHPRFVKARKSSLERGIDPKATWIQYCKPSCKAEQAKLTRCEDAYKIISTVEPERSCIFRYREWVECIEGCVQPKIFYHLRGASRKGPMDWFKASGPSGLH